MGRIYRKHKIGVKYLIVTLPKRWNKVSRKNTQISIENYF